MAAEPFQKFYPYWLQSYGGDGPWHRLGLDESFLETLEGILVGLELIEPGTHIDVGDTFGFVHLADHTIDLRAPFRMVLIERNDDATSDPRRVRLSPYHEGWLATIQRLA